MTPKQMAAIHGKCFTHPRPWSAQEFTDLLASDTVFICKAAHGFALGRVAGPEVELLTIAVDPTHHRQGMARALMDAFEKHAGTKGAKDAFLEVAEDNTAAIALYKAFGFTKAGLRKDYYPSRTKVRISALVMTKSL